MRNRISKPADNRVMFDKDVAEFLGISVRTLKRRLEKPKHGEIDPNDAHPCVIGERRLWLRVEVERLVGIGSTERKSK